MKNCNGILQYKEMRKNKESQKVMKLLPKKVGLKYIAFKKKHKKNIKMVKQVFI